jgi:UDP-2,3-diacylglucosamine hydrolase
VTGERLCFIGDVHLERVDDDLRDFLRCLDRLADGGCLRIVLMGDLFNLWIGRRDLERPHQTAVVNKLVELRSRGVVVRYVEGNRDYGIGACHTGGALDDAALEGLDERFGGRKLFAVHGDLVNVSDRRYRTWRRASRTRLPWMLLSLLPRTLQQRWTEGLEKRMRSTNLEYKREFPETMVRAYAASRLAAGYDAVVLGHFHVERELSVASPSGRIFVLPEWKESRRHLEVSRDGRIRFVDSPV